MSNETTPKPQGETMKLNESDRVCVYCKNVVAPKPQGDVDFEAALEWECAESCIQDHEKHLIVKGAIWARKRERRRAAVLVRALKEMADSSHDLADKALARYEAGN